MSQVTDYELKEVVIGGQLWYQYGEDDEFLKNLEKFKQEKKKDFQRKMSNGNSNGGKHTDKTTNGKQNGKKKEQWKQVNKRGK